MERRRKEMLEKNPSMVDDIGDREKFEVEYSIFMENEKKPGFDLPLRQQKINDQKLNTPLQGTYKVDLILTSILI